MGTISSTDDINYKKIRENVSRFIAACGEKYDREGAIGLDVAPQDHEGSRPHFPKSSVETLDINPQSGATYIADLCMTNDTILPAGRFDYVVCTEVLEHTLQPFDAVRELSRILKTGGVVLVSTPFNFRIHGPLPDCWRFTEHGLRALFRDFNIVELSGLEDDDRFLMPTHYTLVAEKVL